MSGNTELLNFVYQNSQMGMESLSQLLEIAEDEEFRSCMEKQLDKYREFHNEAKRLLQERGHNEKSLGMFDKLKTYLMINMQTMSDKSTSHLAQMLIEGSSMGVTNALQDLRKYEDADTEILRLMRKLYKFEEKNVETYKAFYSNYLDRMDESLLLIKYVKKTLCFRDSRVFCPKRGVDKGRRIMFIRNTYI